MNDSQRIDFLERHGANVVAVSDDALLPDSFSVCIGRITGWHTARNLRDAIDAAEREVRTHATALLAPRK